MKKLFALLLLSSALLAESAVLAAQWYPSVCKVKHYKTCKKPIEYWQTHFTLHGLWPQKKEYCNVPARAKILDKKREWKALPTLVNPSMMELLVTYMPGALAGLHKHEYVKHGSCLSPNPDFYFLTSFSLLSQLNNTPIRLFFLKNRGKRVQTAKIAKLFDKAFFEGAGKRVRFVCEKGYLTELRINLAGDIIPQSYLYDLLRQAKPTKRGCKLGKIGR
ncbi:ribonuclease T2 family protein [Nitratiruptor sp. SB155-2]|uniref:ribonuclease T2 family protein n=1 Tax=Nitratiruptor sp. (strain SB155-2) TaxID=387092 RepID=UPI00015871F2|nr:ribonuclease [Nitratiruptor sp. SB155-2]BAF70652.1 ribonuclease [Nitratiruptor sp. SB155-2]